MVTGKPSIGRIVIYVCADHEPSFNGSREHPAIITRVWSDTCVNLKVFFDGSAGVDTRTSATLITTPGDTRNPNAGWRWPERV